MRPRLLALLLAVPATPAAAQLKDVTDELTTGRVRGRAGIQLEFVQPEGDFRRFVHDGVGVSGFVGAALDHHGQVTLGLGGGFVNYGRRTRTLPLSPTLPGLYVDLTATNNIATIEIPLRVELTRGILRPYLTGSVGLAYFWTETSARGTSSAGDFASTTNYHDVTRNWTAGGGLALQISNKRNPVSLDFGMRHVANGFVNYLNEDSIQDGGGGTTIISPIRTEANFTVYRLGVGVGIR